MHTEQARQYLEEYPPGGARHLWLARRPEVDVEGDDGGEDGDREEDGREEDVLAHERDREGCGRDDLHEEELEDAQGEEDGDTEGNLETYKNERH